MINKIYQLTDKGSLRTLSFILALLLCLAFFLNFNGFSTSLRSVNPLWVLAIMWSIIVLFIHGVGFKIRLVFWQIFFMPMVGLIINIMTLAYIISQL